MFGAGLAVCLQLCHVILVDARGNVRGFDDFAHHNHKMNSKPPLAYSNAPSVGVYTDMDTRMA